jgi:hypothetical protein
VELLLREEKNVPADLKGKGPGSVWTWTALDAGSKPMISWVMSDRSQEAANALIGDLKSRVTSASRSPPMGSRSTWKRS